MVEWSGDTQRTFIGRLCLAATLLAIPAFAQTATPPAFAVAMVKVDKSGSDGGHTGWDNGTNGMAFTAINVPLKNVMQSQAFGIPGPRILGGPKWMDSERFDIEVQIDSATVAQLKALPPEQGKQQMQSMFQQLLADRFQLKTHWETRELPVYALVVANPKNGPALTKAKDPDHSGTSAGNGQLQAVSATLADIAQVMTQEASGELGRVVIDKTGIEGKYDIRLKWTPDFGAGLSSASESSAPPPTGPSIFTAVQEQLGLKLESTKGPVQVLVIDSVAMPSQN